MAIAEDTGVDLPSCPVVCPGVVAVSASQSSIAMESLVVDVAVAAVTPLACHNPGMDRGEAALSLAGGDWQDLSYSWSASAIAQGYACIQSSASGDNGAGIAATMGISRSPIASGRSNNNVSKIERCQTELYPSEGAARTLLLMVHLDLN